MPGRTSKNILPETTLKLAKNFTSIIGIKEASGDMDQYLQLINNKPKDFLIISGDDDLALSSVSAGGHGVISVIGQAFPEKFSKMINYALNKDFSNSRLIHEQLINITSLIFRENNPAGIKSVLHEMNLCNDILRLPLLPVSKNLRSQILAELNNF